MPEKAKTIIQNKSSQQILGLGNSMDSKEKISPSNEVLDDSFDLLLYQNEILSR